MASSRAFAARSAPRPTRRRSAPIWLVGWLWLSNVALLLGSDLNAELEREKELDEVVPHAKTLNPERGG